jgi:hypothetical protein
VTKIATFDYQQKMPDDDTDVDTIQEKEANAQETPKEHERFWVVMQDRMGEALLPYSMQRTLAAAVFVGQHYHHSAAAHDTLHADAAVKSAAQCLAEKKETENSEPLQQIAEQPLPLNNS